MDEVLETLSGVNTYCFYVCGSQEMNFQPWVEHEVVIEDSIQGRMKQLRRQEWWRRIDRVIPRDR